MIKSNAKQRTSDLLEGDIGTTLKRMTIPMILGMVMMMSFGLQASLSELSFHSLWVFKKSR